jgi:hypothetical protein
VSPVRYELGSYIPEDGIHHSRRRENLKSYIVKYKFRGSLGINIRTFDKFNKQQKNYYVDMSKHVTMGP